MPRKNVGILDPSIKDLKAKLRGEADPTKRARIEGRIGFVGKQSSAQQPQGPQARALPARIDPSIKDLKAKLRGETDPTKRARIERRLGFVGKPSSAKQTRGPQARALKETREQSLEGLTRGQNQVINDRQEADIRLGGYANEQLENIQEDYSTPFNWDGVPDAVVGQDVEAWREGQIDSTYNDFTKRLDPQFKQEQDDFEQQMFNRGIPLGSGLYNNQKNEMMQRQNDAKSSALVQAQGIAGSNAGQFFDIGSRARSQGIQDEAMRRGMSLNDYLAISGAQSGMGSQNLQFSQAGDLQRQGADLDLRNAKQKPSGGGGGEAKSAWEKYGFTSPMDFDAYQDERAYNNLKRQKGLQPKGPSSGSQIAGQVGGAIVGAAANWAANEYL